MLQTDQGSYENALQFLKADQKLPRSYSDLVVESILKYKSTEVIAKIRDSNISINPVFLACVYAVENGPVGEMYAGEKVYNLFNFGATTGREEGLKFAYNHQWFTIDDCIKGSDKLFQDFLSRKQNTLYSLDWDYNSFAQNKPLKNYATLVNDAENKAIMMSKTTRIDLDCELIFFIPVFTNISTYNSQPCMPFPDPNKI